MVETKIDITTACGAKCVTCPSWKQKPETMSLERFGELWTKLMDSPMIDRIMINGTGDITAVDGWEKYFAIMAADHRKYTIMTTNGTYLSSIPDGLDELVISFNGATKESYEMTTGLPFEDTVKQIRDRYPEMGKLKRLELHCLIWKETDGDQDKFMELWHDFPGYRRVSFKVENQNEEYFGVERAKQEQRIPCDYLQKLIIRPDGRVAACNHDWHNESNFGNVFADSLPELIRSPKRAEMITKHAFADYGGICERCNYNVSAQGLVHYV